MESSLLALLLVLFGLPLWVFGWAVARRKLNLVFGDFTADTTTTPAWNKAHEVAGRDFRRLGVLLTCSAPVVLLVGLPVGGWLFGLLMAVLVVGSYVLAIRALGHVEQGQLRR